VTVAGLMDMLKERNQILDSFRIPQASRQPSRNNPLRFSPNVEEALRYLLAGRSDSSDYLEAEDALREALKELRLHEQTMHRAMLQAVRDYAEHFDPDELKSRFDRGLKRSGILSGTTNRLKYWELYEENYAALTHREEGGPPQLFAEEFARAYQAELEDARSNRR
jgi:type VI secretion system protein